MKRAIHWFRRDLRVSDNTETLPATPIGWVGRVVVFLVGTAIILVLDGLAVGIQTVRLQFSEGLARDYRGEGRVFRPLRFET